MKTLFLSLVLLGFVAVAPAYAGGGFDLTQLRDEAGDTMSQSGGNEMIAQEGATSTLEGSNLAASGTQSQTVWQIIFAIIIAGGVIAFLIWSFRKSKV